MKNSNLIKLFNEWGIDNPTNDEIIWLNERLALDGNKDQIDNYLGSIKQARRKKNYDAQYKKNDNYLNWFTGARDRFKESLDNGTNVLNGLTNTFIPAAMLMAAITHPVETAGSVLGGSAIMLGGDTASKLITGDESLASQTAKDPKNPTLKDKLKSRMTTGKSSTTLWRDFLGSSNFTAELTNPLMMIGGGFGAKGGNVMLGKVRAKNPGGYHLEFDRHLGFVKAPNTPTKVTTVSPDMATALPEGELKSLPEARLTAALHESRLTAARRVRRELPSSGITIEAEPRSLTPEAQRYWIRRYRQDPEGTTVQLQSMFDEAGIERTPRQVLTAITRNDNLRHNTTGVRGILQRVFGNMRQNPDGTYSGSFMPNQYDAKGNVTFRSQGRGYTFRPLTGRSNPTGSATYGELTIDGFEPIRIDLTEIPSSIQAQLSPRITNGRIRQSFAGYPEESNYLDFFTERSDQAAIARRNRERVAEIMQSRYIWQRNQGLRPVREITNSIDENGNPILTGINIYGHTMVRNRSNEPWRFTSVDDQNAVNDGGFYFDDFEYTETPNQLINLMPNSRSQSNSSRRTISIDEIINRIFNDELERKLLFENTDPIDNSAHNRYEDAIHRFNLDIYKAVRQEELTEEEGNRLIDQFESKILDIRKKRGYDFNNLGIDFLFEQYDNPTSSRMLGIDEVALNDYINNGHLLTSYKQVFGLDDIPVHHIPFPDQHGYRGYGIDPRNIARLYLQDLKNRFISNPENLTLYDLADLAVFFKKDSLMKGQILNMLMDKGYLDRSSTVELINSFINRNSRFLHQTRAPFSWDLGMEKTHAAVFNLSDASRAIREFIGMSKKPGAYYDVHDVSPHSYALEIRGLIDAVKKGNIESVVIPKDANGKPLTFVLNKFSLFNNHDLLNLGVNLNISFLRRYIGNENLPSEIINLLDKVYPDALIKLFADKYMQQGLSKYQAILKALTENEEDPASRAEFVKHMLKGIVIDGNDLSQSVYVDRFGVHVPNIQFRYKLGGKLNYLNLFK